MKKNEREISSVMAQKLEIGLKNRILYGLMYAEDLPVKVLADKLDIEAKELSRWCYQGKLPDKKMRKRLAKYFDIPEKILFWEIKH